MFVDLSIYHVALNSFVIVDFQSPMVIGNPLRVGNPAGIIRRRLAGTDPAGTDPAGTDPAGRNPTRGTFSCRQGRHNPVADTFFCRLGQTAARFLCRISHSKPTNQ